MACATNTVPSLRVLESRYQRLCCMKGLYFSGGILVYTFVQEQACRKVQSASGQDKTPCLPTLLIIREMRCTLNSMFVYLLTGGSFRCFVAVSLLREPSHLQTPFVWPNMSASTSPEFHCRESARKGFHSKRGFQNEDPFLASFTCGPSHLRILNQADDL